MSTISFNNVVKGSNEFDVVLTIDDGEFDEFEFNLADFGEFEYGNDNDKDTIQYPNNCDIEFTIQGCLVDYYPLPGIDGNDRDDYVYTYHKLYRLFKYKDVDVVVNKNNSFYFGGFVDGENISSNFKNKSFRLKVINNIAKLKEVSPKETYLGYDPSSEDKVLFVDLIKAIVQHVQPEVSSVYYKTDLRATVTTLYLGQPWEPGFQYFGDFVYKYIGSQTTLHDNYYDVIKDICNSYGMLFFLKGNSIYLQSRWYHNDVTVSTISRRQFHEGLNAVAQTKKIEGLRVGVRRSTESQVIVYRDYGKVETDKDDTKDENVIKDSQGNIVFRYGSITNSNLVEQIELSSPGGLPPGVPDLSINEINIWIWVPEFVAGIGNAHWTSSIANEFYLSDTPGTKAALWSLIADRVFALVSKSRVVYECTLKGTDWLNLNYYNFETIDNYGFRPRKFNVNYTHNKTKIQFIEGGEGDSFSITPNNAVTQFTKLISVKGLDLWEKGAPAPIDFGSPDKPLESGNGAYVQTEILEASWTGFHGTAYATVEEYDGTVITVDDPEALNTFTEYVMHRFLGDGDSLPSSYPDLNDSNGEWEEYMIVPETEAATYKVEVRIPSNRSAAFFVTARATNVPKLKVKGVAE